MDVRDSGGDSLNDRKFRFAVVCSGPTVRAWQARCVRNLIDWGGADLALVIVEDPPDRSAPHPSTAALFRLYSRLFVRPDAHRPVSPDALFAQVSTVRVGGLDTKGALARASECRLDFVLRFSFHHSLECLYEETPYGVWSFLHDEEEHRGAPPFFREIGAPEHVTRAVLTARTAAERTLVLKDGWFPTIRYSYADQIDAIAFECAKWPAWICTHIRNGVDPLSGCDTVASEIIATPPATSETAALLCRVLVSLLHKKITALYRHPQWAVGIIRSPVSRLLVSSGPPQVEFLQLGSGRARFQADPFGAASDTGLTILFEEFDYRRGKAHISSVHVSQDGQPLQPHPVFVEPYHLSYPYLFRDTGQTYCVPETAHAGRIQILKAEEFPLSWRKVAEIGDHVAGLDTTVFRHDGLWWAAFTEYGSADLNLFLMYAETLTGPWRSHARNPVKTDVRSARPAGTPFSHEGCLYRPAQDSSVSYGGQVRINRITKLTPNEFHEEEASVVSPDPSGPYPDGLHTVCAAGDVTVVDGLRHVFVGSEFRKVVAERWRKTFRGLRSLVSRTVLAPSSGGTIPRVLVLGPVPPPQGGIASMVRDWVNSDLAHDYAFKVFPTLSRDPTGSEKPRASAGHLRRFAAFVWTVIRTRPQIVHIHSSTTFRSTMVYLLLARLSLRRVILHIHGSDWEGFYSSKSSFDRFLKKFSLALPNRIVVLNSEWVRRLVGIGVSTDITIVRNCLKEIPRPDPGVTDAVRRDLGVDKGDLLVLIVAAVCQWKGIFDLVDAIPRIVREHDAVRFVLVGGEEEPGAMARLTGVLAKEDLSRWVRVLGEVDRDRVAALLYAADMFLLPSWMEGMPISVLEAMRAGVPVIATDVGAIPDMITDGVSGLLIRPHAPDSIAEAVLRLSRDVPLRNTIAQCGRKAFEEKFEFSRCIEEMRALYRGVE